MDRRALKGVKILDFGWVIASPMASRHFAMNGATVVRVESALHLDIMRYYTPMVNDTKGVNRCAAFAANNSDKLDVTINWRKPKGMELIRKLVAWCDILFENQRPGSMEKMGLGWEDLQKINSKIIMVRTSLQGQTGPRARNPGFGGSFQFQTGLTELSGWPDRLPTAPQLPITDMIPPWYTAFVAIAALEYRDKTGKGLYIDGTQYESTLNYLSPAILEYTANGSVLTRSGNRLAYACPHGVFRCQGDDRWVAIAVFTDTEWRDFVNVVGIDELSKSEEFKTLTLRKENEDALERIIEVWTMKQTAKQVTTKLQEAGIAAGVVATNHDLHRDPQLAHRRHFIKLNHLEMGLRTYDAPSYRFSKTLVQPRKAAPCLGEHTKYVCNEILGISDEEFSELSKEGVFE